MLTARQHTVLVFINSAIRDTGICPSFDEIGSACGMKSKSQVSRVIGSLERRGFIRRARKMSRSIEVIRLPCTHALPDVVSAAKRVIDAFGVDRLGFRQLQAINALADAIKHAESPNA